MKLRQKEYCHNCDTHVMFEFEDITERQIIVCPNCSHQHFRELDYQTILDIRIDQTRGEGQFRTLRVAKMPETSLRDISVDMDAPIMPPPIEVTEYQILGRTDDGKAIVKAKFEEGQEVKAVISQRRWGQDPRQRG